MTTHKDNLNSIKNRILNPLVFLYTAISASIYVIIELATFCHQLWWEDYAPTSSSSYAFLFSIIILGCLLRYIYQSVKYKSWKNDIN